MPKVCSIVTTVSTNETTNLLLLDGGHVTVLAFYGNNKGTCDRNYVNNTSDYFAPAKTETFDLICCIFMAGASNKFVSSRE